MSYTIYHNPRCKKSRETLSILRDHQIEPKVIKYLDHPPSRAELIGICKKLGIQPSKLLRKNEKLFKETYQNMELSADGALDAMVKYPKLIERPVVVKEDQAVIGRPPENVVKLIG